MESRMVIEIEEIQEKKVESKEFIEEEFIGVGLNKDKEIEERIDGERVVEVVFEERENVVVVKLQESQLGNVVIDKEIIDLLVFIFVVELELLGLKREFKRV